MSVTKRDAIKAQRMKKKRQQRMNTILGVGGVLVVLILILASPTIYNELKPAGDFVRITPVARPLADGKAMGNPNAPVTIEVFEDFQCPSCKGYTETIEKQLSESNYISGGQVYYIFRQFPFIDSNSITKESHQAANASMCAMEQGQFWDYHDILFANQSGENQGSFNDKRLQAFAESLGLDMTAFNKCFNANTYSTQIQDDLQMGQNYGVTGTPTVFLNGTLVTPGQVPTYDQLKAAIDAALAGGGG
jgi:protein-disulfide isomerase